MQRLRYVFSALFIFATAAFADAPAHYDIIARLNDAPGNVTVAENGRIFMSLHQFYDPKYSVAELLPNGTLAPFPNQALNDRVSNGGLKLDSVLGIRADGNGIVWMLDNGLRSGVMPKLVGWSIRSNSLYRAIFLPEPLAPKDAFVNDFALDLRHNHAFISDPAGGADAALIVVDLTTGKGRRVLQGHRYVLPEAIDLLIDGRPVQVKDPAGNLVRPRVGVNPITEDAQNEWVYFGAMHGRSLYRVRAADLVDAALSEAALGQRVERYSDKPISDGISIDRDNNIYLGELAENAIGVITPDRKYRRLAQSADLSWVDSFSFGPRGALYAVVNRLHGSAMLNGGERSSRPPYFLLRVQSLAEGVPGR
ncbi:MAG: hypothetical protein EPN21_09950 [Methylococcaceae bacterium]|nr:MAG: hypothetical protein EPN21_09950 [Methylococcaceae bacterium]